MVNHTLHHHPPNTMHVAHKSTIFESFFAQFYKWSKETLGEQVWWWNTHSYVLRIYGPHIWLQCYGIRQQLWYSATRKTCGIFDANNVLNWWRVKKKKLNIDNKLPNYGSSLWITKEKPEHSKIKSERTLLDPLWAVLKPETVINAQLQFEQFGYWTLYGFFFLTPDWTTCVFKTS